MACVGTNGKTYTLLLKVQELHTFITSLCLNLKNLRLRWTKALFYIFQTLKGNDDLRQDAVMEQVFTAMNVMLKTQLKTKKRCLTMRTYKVVPLSQRSGVIEWCDGTQTMTEYLCGVGTPGAHTIYRPNDYEYSRCRRMMIVSLVLLPNFTINLCDNFSK